MSPFSFLKEPAIPAPLDPGFRPAVLANRAFSAAVESGGGGVPLVLGLERNDGQLSRYETTIFDKSDPQQGANSVYAERLLKFLLWQRGAFRVHVGGPAEIGEDLARLYSSQGERAFDTVFMGEKIYGRPFEVISCAAEEVPPEKEAAAPLGRHLEGCRIGFDLGASDLKISAVVDGNSLYSDEIVWEPRKNADPTYHYDMIVAALHQAAEKLPRVDAIGGSSAGVYVDNSARIASLFRAVPADRFHAVHDMFQRIQKEFGVPLTIINDGNVSALAGSMALEDTGVLGLAFGSSEAAGYVGQDGTMMDWLNELAFSPIDYNPHAPRDEWSDDRGCGVQYLSQQAVFRLAGPAGIELPEAVTDAEKLRSVQEKLASGHEGAMKIWQSMAVYLGYALAHYADFYDLKHVLLLGRCTSGEGGDLLLQGAGEVLKQEFPQLAEELNIQLPDEKTRRVGQSVAAASLPALGS
jgi:predicted NBD/HSP70 family sugar kinase